MAMSVHRSLNDGIYSHESGPKVFEPPSLVDLSIEKINRMGIFKLSRVPGGEFNIWNLTPENYKLLRALPLKKVIIYGEAARVIEEMDKCGYQLACEGVKFFEGREAKKIDLSFLKQKNCFPNVRKITFSSTASYGGGGVDTTRG